MDNPINLAKLKSMIDMGLSRIPKDPTADEAVIVIGDTGVGKSTILAFLSGAKLYVRYDGLKPTLDCPEGSNVKIGHNKYSQTSIPNKIVIDGIAFYDCPGFRDNKGQQYEISNSFFVQRLLDIYAKVKIVLMIDESHISQARADKLPRLIKNLLKSFRTFQDIKNGVNVIVNRAERDFGPADYHKQILKMCTLSNNDSSLFQPEQQNFLKFLVNNNRILLFKQPLKQDKNKVFVPTEYERGIMPAIKRSDYVKSKHILNILSQSAKLAIRDFIDEITAKSNIKIQAICQQIVSRYQMRFSRAGRDVRGLIDIKQEVIRLAQEIKSCKKEQIPVVLQRQLPLESTKDFKDDFESVMFFKGVYDKTATYFSNLENKIYSQLSRLLVKMDTRIMSVQKQQQQQIQRQRQLTRRKQLQQQREKERNQMMQQMNQMQQLRRQVHQMGQSSHSMIQSLGDTMGYLNSLQEEFRKLKEDANRLQSMNQEMHGSLTRIQATYIKRQSIV